MSKQRNPFDEAALQVAAEQEAFRKEGAKARPVPSGTERLSARDYRNRVEQMTPEQRVAAYRADPDGFLKAMQGVE